MKLFSHGLFLEWVPFKTILNIKKPEFLDSLFKWKILATLYHYYPFMVVMAWSWTWTWFRRGMHFSRDRTHASTHIPGCTHFSHLSGSRVLLRLQFLWQKLAGAILSVHFSIGPQAQISNCLMHISVSLSLQLLTQHVQCQNLSYSLGAQWYFKL